MAEVIAQVNFQGVSGLPKDIFENVLNFNTSGAITPDMLGTIAIKIVDFYTLNTGSGAVGSFLSGMISPHRGLIKMYDRAAASPRPVLATATFTMPSPGSSPDLPAECAVCLSYFTDRNAPRHRGRIFLGPLNGAANDNGNVANGFVAVLRASALRLVTVVSSAGFTAANALITARTGIPAVPVQTVPDTEWALYSPTAATSVAIQHGWVDNAFDTQRRRGIAPTVRSTW